MCACYKVVVVNAVVVMCCVSGGGVSHAKVHAFLEWSTFIT